MKQFISVNDVPDLPLLLKTALDLKAEPFADKHLGENKMLGLIFFNPSLRTRLSTQKAAVNLGMQVMVMNAGQDGWALETEDGVLMNGNKAEHIKEAAAVMGRYCDILGVRSFPELLDKERDYSEHVIKQFIKYSGVPIISLESGTLHPLQSFADLITITESGIKKPKVVLTWAPHIRALPQAVPNSFVQWMGVADVDFTITNPKGYELESSFTKNVKIEYDQEKALENANFIYVKNWSAYNDYGKILTDGKEWMLTEEKLKNAAKSKIMHCLPVRRGLELSDEILDGPRSLVLDQAENRVFAAQAVLKSILSIL